MLCQTEPLDETSVDELAGKGLAFVVISGPGGLIPVSEQSCVESKSLSGSYNLGQIALAKLSKLAAQVETLEAARAYLETQLAEKDRELDETSRSILRIHAAYENRIAELERTVEQGAQFQATVAAQQAELAALRAAPGGPAEVLQELAEVREALAELETSHTHDKQELEKRDAELTHLKALAGKLVHDEAQKRRRLQGVVDNVEAQLRSVREALQLPIAAKTTEGPTAQPAPADSLQALQQLLAGQSPDLSKLVSKRSSRVPISKGRGAETPMSPRERARLASQQAVADEAEKEKQKDAPASKQNQNKPSNWPPARPQLLRKRMETIDKLAAQALAGSLSAVDTGEFPVPGYTPNPGKRGDADAKTTAKPVRTGASGAYAWAAIFLAIVAGSVFLLKGLILDDRLQGNASAGTGNARPAQELELAPPDSSQNPAANPQPQPDSQTPRPVDPRPNETRPQDPAAAQPAATQTVAPAATAAPSNLPADLQGLVAELKKAIADSDKLRIAAIEDALFQLGNPALPQMTALLRSARDVLVKTSLVRVISRVRNNKDVGELIYSIENADRASRLRATLDLAKVEDPAAVPQLVELATHNNDDNVRNSALIALGNIHSPEAIAGLQNMARVHTDEDSRVSAVMMLTQKKDQGSIGLFEDLTADTSSKVRRAALLSLGNLGATGALQTVLGAVHTERDDDARGEAVRTIGKIGTSNELRLLRDLLKTDPNEAVRSHARDAIQRIEMQQR